MTLTNGAVGGIDALTYAADALESGRATTMLVGAVEKIPRVALAVPPPGTDCRWSAVPRPFDRCRTGSLLGEAGVVAVLERAGGARHRGAEARARLSATASAFSPDNSLEDASRRSLNWALNACSLIPEDVGAVFAGANGSLGGDAAESRALYAIFGDRMPVCAVKGATADSMGAAALVQLAVALISMRRSLIPGTAGFRSLGDDIAPIKVVSTPEPQRRTPVVIHAWDAGSCSASAVLDKYDARTSPHPSPRRPDAA
jgi:3-oxoacyl-[acyl-carrier-protein] synthase II